MSVQERIRFDPHWPALYPRFPSYRTFNSKTGWKPRKNKPAHGFVPVGRLPIVSPSELFAMRLLLFKEFSNNATCFADLRTINGVEFPSFVAAATSLNLLRDSNELRLIIQDWLITITAGLREIRRSIAILLNWTSYANVAEIIDEVAEQLGDDFPQHIKNDPVILKRVVKIDIEKLTASVFVRDYVNLFPPLQGSLETLAQEAYASIYQNQNLSSVNSERLRYPIEAQTIFLQENIGKLNSEQRSFYDKLIGAFDRYRQDPSGRNDHLSRVFYVNALGGSGKTFVTSLIMAKVRSEGCIAIATASSGVASTLLNGTTFHRRFKIYDSRSRPSNGVYPSWRIAAKSQEAKLIRESSLIVIDEITMLKKDLLEVLDLSLREFMRTDVIFGGKVILMTGDFRQCLPVVKRRTEAQIVSKTILQYSNWDKVDTSIRLSVNMRLHRNVVNLTPEEFIEFQFFDQWLRNLGNGRITIQQYRSFKHLVEVPQKYVINASEGIDKLIAFVFPELFSQEELTGIFGSRAILAPTNVEVDSINTLVTAIFPGDQVELYSADDVNRDLGTDYNGWDVSVLHSMRDSGMPPHVLILKKDMPLVLLKNYDLDRGLSNGTKLILTDFLSTNGHIYRLKCKIASGTHAGTEVEIPRITNSADDHNVIKWSRLQFPVVPAFAMTISKSQGQTLNRVGIYLMTHCFTHGMRYVAASRVDNPNNLKLFIPDIEDKEGLTTSINFAAVLQFP
jgi:ATP-dependent DNA helicase PIF1